MTKEIWSDLNDVFSFGTGIKAAALDLSTDDGKGAYMLVAESMNIPGDEARELMNKCASYPDFGLPICFNDDKLNYLLFISGISEQTPCILGGIMTNAEHKTKHIRNLGSSESAYRRNFSGPVEYFLNAMGYLYIAKKNGLEVDMVPLDIGDPYAREVDSDDWIGHCVATRVFDFTPILPYSEIFHSPDQRRMWEIVNGIIKPRVDIFIPKGMDKDLYYKQFKESMEKAELKGEINIIERLP